MARLFTKRRVNLGALTRTLRNTWHFVQNFEVRDLGSKTVLIIFDDETAPQKILSQGPWSFDKYLVRLYRPKDKESVDDATFVGASFWVQFHYLPLRRMNKATTEAIGKTLGTIEQVDASLSGKCRSRFLHVRIHLDITKPLSRGKMVKMTQNRNGYLFNTKNYRFSAIGVVSSTMMRKTARYGLTMVVR